MVSVNPTHPDKLLKYEDQNGNPLPDGLNNVANALHLLARHTLCTLMAGFPVVAVTLAPVVTIEGCLCSGGVLRVEGRDGKEHAYSYGIRACDVDQEHARFFETAVWCNADEGHEHIDKQMHEVDEDDINNKRLDKITAELLNVSSFVVLSAIHKHQMTLCEGTDQ